MFRVSLDTRTELVLGLGTETVETFGKPMDVAVKGKDEASIWEYGVGKCWCCCGKVWGWLDRWTGLELEVEEEAVQTFGGAVGVTIIGEDDILPVDFLKSLYMSSKSIYQMIKW